MNIQNNLVRYILGAFTGILIVAGCGGSGGGSGSVINTANGATITGVSAQLLCIGDPSYMVGTTVYSTGITCMSSTSAIPQNFPNFYTIVQLGWILVHTAPEGGAIQSSVYIFQK